jgi:glycine/D-amino acid oxidase-like deaminating enzyme
LKDRDENNQKPSTGPLRILVVGAGVSGISVARGLLRDGHDVTVFDQRPNATAGGGAVTIWSNGATVLEQLGVDMDGAGQLLCRLCCTAACWSWGCARSCTARPAGRCPPAAS